MRAVFRLWWIIAVGMAGVALLSGFCIRIGIDIPVVGDDVSPAVGLSKLLLFGFAYFGFLGVLFAACFLELFVYFRAYKNLYSDEAYLTFMLPVKRRTLLDEKLLHCFIWQTISLLLVIVCSAIMVLAGFFGTGLSFSDIIAGIRDRIGEYPEEFTSALPVIIAEIIIVMFTTNCSSAALVLMCLTIGAVIARKHKLLASIGIHYGISSVIGIFAMIINLTTLFSVTSGWFTPAEEVIDKTATLYIVGMVGAIILLTVACFFVFRAITLKLMNKKLNLTS